MNATIRSLAGLGLALVLAGCASQTTLSGGGTPEPSSAVPHPTGADEVVLQVRVGGGFVPYAIALTEFPNVTVFGDGTVITQVATEEWDRALPELERRTLTPEGMQILLRRAQELGLLGEEIEYGLPGITDSPTTVLEITTDESHLHAAYALGFEDDGPSAAEARARQVLTGFLDELEDLPALVGDEVSDASPYVPARLAVHAFNFDEAELTPEGDPVAWPVPGLSQAVGNSDCFELTGHDVATALPALEGATITTPFSADGATWQLIVRPLLPSDQACTD